MIAWVKVHLHIFFVLQLNAVLENKDIEGKTNFFQNGLFFWVLVQKMIIPNDCIRFADIKNHFVFSDHSSGKRFRQNDDVPIVNLQLFFRRNPPDLWGMKKTKWMFKTRQKLVKKKNSVGEFQILSCFEHTKKKVSPYERNFLLFLPLKCWSNIFWLLWGFIRWCVNVFFCKFKTRNHFEKTFQNKVVVLCD